ncbi:MAG: flavodoxin family protein [Halanaerobiales bacterium]|nr:flavodoxin family protein [Halanaerobiales bacterium]
MITVISASHRKSGNTDKMLDIFIDEISKTNDLEKIKLINYDLNICEACLDCHQDGLCILEDDINDLYKRVEKAEGMIISSPIYFASITSVLKIFIDRAEPYRAKNILQNDVNKINNYKKGYFLGVGAYKTDLFYNNAKEIIKNYFHSLNTKYTGELFFKGVEKKVK